MLLRCPKADARLAFPVFSCALIKNTTPTLPSLQTDAAAAPTVGTVFYGTGARRLRVCVISAEKRRALRECPLRQDRSKCAFCMSRTAVKSVCTCWHDGCDGGICNGQNAPQFFAVCFSLPPKKSRFRSENGSFYKDTAVREVLLGCGKQACRQPCRRFRKASRRRLSLVLRKARSLPEPPHCPRCCTK